MVVDETVKGAEGVWTSFRQTANLASILGSFLVSTVGLVVLSVVVGILVLFLFHQTT